MATIWSPDGCVAPHGRGEVRHGGKSVLMHATAYCDIRTAGSTPATTARDAPL